MPRAYIDTIFSSKPEIVGIRLFHFQKHSDRVLLPFEGPLAHALENRVDLFLGHVLMITRPTENGRGRTHATAGPQGGAGP